MYVISRNNIITSYDDEMNILAIAPEYHGLIFGEGFTDLPLEVGGRLKNEK